MSKGPFYAGLDIGGTTVKSMLVDADGKQVGEIEEVRSHVKEGYRKTFEQLKASLDLLSKQVGIGLNDIAGIGLDVPAPCSNGVIWGRANLGDDWVGTNICAEFTEEIGKPVLMTNDGNAAAYGEWLFRPDREGGLLFVAPGTGLGGGLVLNGGGMYEGSNGLAMEVSDITVPFEDEGKRPCDASGREGALEAWVSLVALRRGLAIALKDPKYAKHPLAKDSSPIEEKAFQLRDYAEKQDELALTLFGRQANILGYGLADMASLFDPGLVVVGGGLAETGFRGWYLDEVRKGFNDRAATFYKKSPLAPHTDTTTFEWAIGGDASAAFGAARMAVDVA